MNEYSYLVHGGPGSGRYPWGSGDRPYQRLEGANQQKRSSIGISGYIKDRKAKKAQRLRNEELRQRMKLEEKKRQFDADKEKVIRKGSATEVMKYQGELTNQELQSAYTRLNLEAQLKGLSQKELMTSIDKVEKITKTIKTGSDLAKVGTEAYNTFAAIYNATPYGKDNPLTLVSKGDGGKKDNK